MNNRSDQGSNVLNAFGEMVPSLIRLGTVFSEYARRCVFPKPCVHGDGRNGKCVHVSMCTFMGVTLSCVNESMTERALCVCVCAGARVRVRVCVRACVLGMA